MSWREMQTVNDRRCPWAWSRPKVMLNIALAVLFTTGAILVGFMFPAAADERPPDRFGNHTIELNKDVPLASIWVLLRDRMQIEKAYFHECLSPHEPPCPSVRGPIHSLGAGLIMRLTVMFRCPRLRLLPTGAVAGWDLHPLESAALSRRTPGADIRSAP